MAIQIKIDTRNGVKGLAKAVKGARDLALHDVAVHWWRAILPDHFKAYNMGRYDMKKRTPKHQKRKRREGRPADPNVYTGRLRDKMIATRPDVTVNRQGVKLVFRGLPRHTFVTTTYEKPPKPTKARPGTVPDWDDRYLKGKHPKHVENIIAWRARRAAARHKGGAIRVERPDKVAELTAVDSADARKLARKFQEFFSAALKRLGGK